MAQKKFHRKQFMVTTGATILAAFGFNRARSPQAAEANTANPRADIPSIARKEPRAVPADKGSTLA